MPLSSNTNFTLNANTGQFQNIGGINVPFTFSAAYRSNMTSGTGSSQGNTVVVLTPTIAGGANYTVDLLAVPGGTNAGSGNPFGTVTFTSVTTVLVSFAAQGTMSLAPGASNGWSSCFAGAINMKCPTGNRSVFFQQSPSFDGYAVTSACRNLFISNTGTTSLTPSILIVGRA